MALLLCARLALLAALAALIAGYVWAGLRDPGLQREVNEDRFHADVALTMVRIRFERETGPTADRVREAITIANNEIHRVASLRPEWTERACVHAPAGWQGRRQGKGWNRPIRDDVLDTRPHGTIDVHEGLVHSCNAYFAQLAITLGPEPLVSTAAGFGSR